MIAEAGPVDSLRLDEHRMLAARRTGPTALAHGSVDLRGKLVLVHVEDGPSGVALTAGKAVPATTAAKKLL